MEKKTQKLLGILIVAYGQSFVTFCSLNIDNIELSRHTSVGRASAFLVSHCEQQYIRSQFRAPTIPAHRYMEEKVATLAAKRSADVAPEVNFREHVTCMRLSVRIRLPTLALKPRRDITRCPKQGYQRLHKKDLYLQCIFKKYIDNIEV